MRLSVLPFLLATILMAGGEDPFEVPTELQGFTRAHTNIQSSVSTKMTALLHAFFRPAEEGGLGMSYDNAYTRTIPEAWRDRKANCLTLTALYVAACRSIGIEARFGESLRVNRWRRVGTTIRYERHVVAVVPSPTLGQEIVLDFLPDPQRGSHLILLLDPKRILALFHSNRAVELLESSQPEEAMAEARRSIQVDASSGIGWNILGVVQRNQGLDAEAEASFRKAIEIDPRDGTPCGNMENLLRAQGRTAEAQVHRERGLEIRKADPYFNAFLAEEALEAGRWDEAEKRVKQAIRLLPQDPEFYLIQARVCLAQGERKAAIKALERAKKWALPEMQARWDSKLALLRGDKPV